MKIKTTYIFLAAAVLLTLCATSCSDSKSYAELLTLENQYVNRYLVDQHVSNTIPTDTNFVFEYGPDAPYYRLDEDGNLYMQVIKPGTKGNYATDDQIIYFRFTRYNLAYYLDGELPEGDGNDEDMSYLNSWFRFNNYSLQSSYQWGAGLQAPLKYLPIDCEVNIIIKSQFGFYDETSYVQPFLYRVRYYKQLT